MHFSTTQVAQAAGFDPAAFRNYLARGHLITSGDTAEHGGGRGKTNHYSRAVVVQAAIARSLMDAGVSPAKAFAAGAKFAHTATVDQASTTITRLPGELFREGRTFMIYDPINDLVSIRKDLDPRTPFTSESAVIVNLNLVVFNVDRRLDQGPAANTEAE